MINGNKLNLLYELNNEQLIINKSEAMLVKIVYCVLLEKLIEKY
jgi:hypothetical protein